MPACHWQLPGPVVVVLATAVPGAAISAARLATAPTARTRRRLCHQAGADGRVHRDNRRSPSARRAATPPRPHSTPERGSASSRMLKMHSKLNGSCRSASEPHSDARCRLSRIPPSGPVLKRGVAGSAGMARRPMLIASCPSQIQGSCTSCARSPSARGRHGEAVGAPVRC